MRSFLPHRKSTARIFSFFFCFSSTFQFKVSFNASFALHHPVYSGSVLVMSHLMGRILTLMVHYESVALVLRIHRNELFFTITGRYAHTYTQLNVSILCKGQILFKFQLFFSHLHLFRPIPFYPYILY